MPFDYPEHKVKKSHFKRWLEHQELYWKFRKWLDRRRKAAKRR